ncbi:MAG: sugar transferase [Bacteroidales bacterium]|nr:MAG: sugar transferase [Bacteroidales bacterium]
MNKKQQVTKYLIFDILAAILSWTLFYIFRKVYLESQMYGFDIPIIFGTKYFLSLIIIPVFWITLYYLNGYYRDIFRKSRLIELGQTLFICIVGVIIIFFSLLLDDTVQSYKDYYKSVLVLFLLHFFLTYIPRLILTSITIRRIHNGAIGFNTLLVGGNSRAVNIIKELKAQKKLAGSRIIGFVTVNRNSDHLASQYVENLGTIEDIVEIILRNKVEEVIIAIESSEQDTIGNIINKLNQTVVSIKAVPSIYDILTGRVRISSLYGTPLLEITHDLIPTWQFALKHVFDITISIIALILLSPLIPFLAIGIKMTSKGPVIYSHERVGRYGEPFKLYKFRTMVVDAEKNGPELSSKNDSRITPFGRFMRKHRLDEIPNFINVLKGEMSLVGPRPERKFYIDQIMEKAPQYLHLQKVKPGITSWGQVKYGYAENVDEMVERLKYDIIYIENMTLYVDFKILIYTLITIFKGRGI